MGWVACPPEFETDPSGRGAACREIVPEAECAAGTMPLLGSRECVPVGPAKCENGFEKDPSGWGCRAIVAAKSCVGATRDALGSATCVPVGDCSAPFPPANATMFVSAAFTDGELGPTKFKTIASALAAASANAVIAVDSGTYADGIIPKASVSVIGRCAEKVRLVGTGLEVQGVLAELSRKVTVKGVTLVDHYEGARVMGAGNLTLEDVVIEAPRFTGLIAWQPKSSIVGKNVVVRNVKPHEPQSVPVLSVNADEGGSIELVDSSIANSWDAGLVATNEGAPSTPSVVRLTHSVIRDTNIEEHSSTGAAIVISGTSRGEVTDSAILDSRRNAAITLYPGPELTMTRTEIRRTLDDKDVQVSAAVYSESGKITLEDVSMHEVVQAGLFVRGKGSITAKGTVIHGTKPGADGVFGMAAWADTGGKIALERTALVDNAYYGVSAITGANIKLNDVLIRGTAAEKVKPFGLGRGVNIEDGASVDIDGVSIVSNDGEGLFVRGETKEGKRARATAKRMFVAHGRTRDAHGIFIAKGGLADVDGAAIVDAQRVGIIVNETLGEKGSHSEATLTHVVVRGTKRADHRESDAKNIDLDGIGIGSAGKLTVRSSAIVDNVQFGIMSGTPELLTLENSFLGGTKPNDDGSFGHGFVGLKGGNVIIKNTEIAGNNIGLMFDGASAIVASSRVRGNTVGIHAQHDVTLAAGAKAPEAPEVGTVFVTDDSEFLENTTRVGGGEVPLPANPFPSFQ